jgi:ubiquinone/menaquinone biosynthesis C-methylase UbiE/uncharacterized protein YbaR (Trm112 family)
VPKKATQCMPFGSEDVPYSCPYDCGRIAMAAGAYRCGVCARIFPIIDGIPNFIGHALHPESSEHQRERDSFISPDEQDYGSPLRNLIEIPFTIEKLAARPGDLVLDIACGKGRIAIPLLQHVPVRLVGIDFSLAALKGFSARAQKVGVSAQLAIADATRLPFQPANFDRVILSMVLENIGSEEIVNRMLKSVAEVMRTTGRLLLTTFNYSQMVREVLHYPKRGHFPDSRIACRFDTPDELKDLLSQYFVVEDLMYLVSTVPKISGAFQKMGRPGLRLAAVFDRYYRHRPRAQDRARILAAICRPKRNTAYGTGAA